MKIFVNAIVIVCGAAIGLAIGFAWRGKADQTGSPTAKAVFSEPAEGKLSRVATRRARIRLNDDSPLATKLEHDLSMSSGVTKWLYWLEALEKAGPTDFPRLVRLAQGNSTAMRFVSARWVEVAPRHLFDTLVASRSGADLPAGELGNILFQEWPKRDPEAVIAALNGTNDFGMRIAWRRTAANSIIETDVERGLRIFSEWQISNFGPRMTAVGKWAAADPRHAAEFTLEHASGFVSEMTMEVVGKEWAKQDPARALEFAAMKSGKLAEELARSVLKEWTATDLGAAAEWLVNADVATRNRLSATFVEAWAKEDAGNALAWCAENLTGSALAKAVGGVVKGMAAKDVTSAASLVASLGPSNARTEAAAAVAKRWFPNLSSEKAVAPEMIAWLAGLDAASTRRVLDEVTWGWATSDPKTLAAFLTVASSDHVPPHTYPTLARQMARNNPSEALEWASRLPEASGLPAGADAFAEWRSSQPEAAMKWLNELPSTDKRREPFFKSAIRSLAYHPLAAEQLALMNASDRAAARNVIETMGLPHDRRSQLLDALAAR